MPTYIYEAAYTGGKKVNGVVEASSQNEAVIKIRQNCDVVLTIKEVPYSKSETLSRLKKINAKNLAITSKQFSIILRAGLPLVQTVDLVAGQTNDKVLAKLLKQVSEDVSNGWSLSYSLEQRGEKLPVTFRETIRAGEESGDLVTAFERMADYYDRTAKTQAKAISTITYPVFVIVVAVIVVTIIMGYAVPAFINTFQSMGVQLPPITVALIAVSNFFSKYALFIIFALAVIIIFLNVYRHTKKGGKLLSKFYLSIPVIGKIGRMAGASQFAHTMSTMLAAGMPILQAIEVSGRAMSNICMSEEVLKTIPGVEGGRALGECMASSQQLPKMLVEMTAMGESTGSMESTLEVLANYYDNEVSVSTDRALSLLEPIIICVLAVFVVFILLAVYLPMFSMYSSI